MLFTRASCAAALEELELDGLDGHALDGRRFHPATISLISLRRLVEWERLEDRLSARRSACRRGRLPFPNLLE